MAKKEEVVVQEILNRLIDGTKDGSVIWQKTNSTLNTDKLHNYYTKTEDGKTKFTFEIILDDKLVPNKNFRYVYIHNSNLNEGIKQINDSFKGLDVLQNLIYNKWIKPNLPVKNESEVIINILNSIGDKQSRRNIALEEILDNSKKKSIWNILKKK